MSSGGRATCVGCGLETARVGVAPTVFDLLRSSEGWETSGGRDWEEAACEGMPEMPPPRIRWPITEGMAIEWGLCSARRVLREVVVVGKVLFWGVVSEVVGARTGLAGVVFVLVVGVAREEEEMTCANSLLATSEGVMIRRCFLEEVGVLLPEFGEPQSGGERWCTWCCVRVRGKRWEEDSVEETADSGG